MKLNENGFELNENDWYSIIVIVFLIMYLK